MGEYVTIRYLHGDKKILRLGWVIVDDSKRGRGYGKEMLTLGLEFAFNIMKAEKVTIGVFEKNLSAYFCYQSAGFHNVDNAECMFGEICGEKQKIIEMEINKSEFD